MADTKITALTGMTGAETTGTDVFPIVDVSIPQTKKITKTELFRNVAELQLQGGSPALRFIEDDGGVGYNTVRFIRATDSFVMQTLNGETVVSTEYTVQYDATGAVLHAWRIGNVEKLRINSNGFIGVGVAAPLVSIDAVGDIQTRGTMFVNQVTPTSKAAAATLTAAELLTKIIQYTGATATLTAPLGADIITGLPTSLTNNAAFDFSIINTGAGTVTFAGNTNSTLIGSGSIPTLTSASFRMRKQNATTCVIYRMS